MNAESFYIVEKEVGAESNNIPLWANKIGNPANLAETHNLEPELKEIEQVPGAFQLLNILSKKECESLINIAETLSFNKEAAVSLPRHIRHNDSLTWVVDEETDSIIWERSKPLLSSGIGVISNLVPIGINARFRFYKYEEGDFFKPHIDGSWPGSRIINSKNVHDAYGDRWSQMTFLIFLSEEFEGGETQFWVNKNDPTKPANRSEHARLVNIRTPAGSVLCFPHGSHPLHCLHSSEKVTKGVKYIIRTDLLFPLN
ncbi:MAG: oxidoreductase [Alteromonadaceae bacterium]|nr:oxidoreductase [Alteromonadaceae bacterium]